MNHATTSASRLSGAIAPGPRGVPYFGSVFRAWREPIDLFLDARARYGDVVHFTFGPYDYYLVNDPDVVRHVLVDNAKAYTKSRNYLGLKVILGEGLLTSEGDHWRRQRRLAQPAFHRARLDAFAAKMARATRDLSERWTREPEGASFDVHAEMMRLTFRIVGLALFSSDVDGVAKDVGRAMDVAMHWANDYAQAFIRVPRWVPTPTNVRFKRAMETLDRVVARLVDERRAQPKDGSFGDDLLGMLMSAKDEDGSSGMSDVELRDEIITMILAGHETTANLLTWTFYLLSKHPEIERRVRDEALRVLDRRDPTLEDVRALEYTRMVLDEALRLYPPAWVFERQAHERDVLGGYPIASGNIVAISPYVLHRHPAYWENPEGFDPERFRPGAEASRPRWAYLPFGGGQRMCIGNHFALIEAQIILAMIVRDHHLSLDPSRKIEMDPVITLRPKTGVYVRRRSPAR